MLQLALPVVLLLACNRATHNPDDEEVYKGPLVEAHDVLTLYSDSAKLKVKLTAPLQQEYQNGDGIFPKGVKVTFFEVEEQPTSTLVANYGKFDKAKNVYIVTGNVVVRNLKKKETLNTEELTWDKRKAEVYTDKFVRIETPTEILTGQGLQANQDFSRYRILKPSGIFTVQQP